MGCLLYTSIVLSLVVLYASALALIWMAGKIYRVGILMYGKKPSIGEMAGEKAPRSVLRRHS